MNLFFVRLSKDWGKPSAFTSIYYIRGHEGRYGVVRAACEDELRKIASDEGKRLKELKQNENN
jgi:hypothetical protein